MNLRKSIGVFTLIAVTGITLSIASCKDGTTSTLQTDPVDTTSHAGQQEWQCGSYNGHQLYTGPKGGCYYYNSSGNKTYVDKSNCNC